LDEARASMPRSELESRAADTLSTYLKGKIMAGE
jgi:hypothetical protein